MYKKFAIFVLGLFSMFVFSQEMETDLKEAFEQAGSLEKDVVVVFSGSDWCINCMKLKKYILDTEEFQNEVGDHFIFYHADFPQKSKNKKLQSEDLQADNNWLAEKYNPNGYFPFVVVLSPDKDLKGQLEYEDVSPKEYAEKLKSFQ